MTPAFVFWLSLILKMAITAIFVVVATLVAERSGPLVGGLISTLPISAGPVYVFLALEHPTQFIADSAVASLAINPVIAVFALAYAFLAQRHRREVSILAALTLWLVLAVIVHLFGWSVPTAIAFNVVVLPICLFLVRPLREAQISRLATRWSDVAARAASVALLVAAVVALSVRIGPAATGILALFPIVMTSIMFILHGRVGGKAAAAVMASSITGLIGLALAFIALHFAVVPLGAAWGLSLALFVSIGWSLLVWLAKRNGMPV
jgi:uncharacterized membrane protein (GlpM family)